MALSRVVGRVLREALAATSQDRIRDRVAQVAHGCRADRLHGLADAAAHHGVPGYALEAVTGVPGIPAPQVARLRALRDRTALRHLQNVADLSWLSDVLGTARISWLAIKGPTLTPAHEGADRRSYGDLDVVVPGPALGDAISTLERAGAEMLDRNWTLIREEMKGEVHLRLPSGTPLDLHWHLLNHPELRRAFPIDVTELFTDRVEMDIGGLTVPALAPPATVTYVALHTMLTGADRLVWLKDLDRLLDLHGNDVPAIVDQARSWRADLVLSSAIRRTASEIGSPLPPWLPATASHRVWWTISGASCRLSPVHRADGGQSIARMVARATRATPSASLRELVRRVGARARYDDSHRRRRTRVRPYAVTDPRSGRYPSGGQDRMIEFLEEVTHA